jgi:hypothetical protein
MFADTFRSDLLNISPLVEILSSYYQQVRIADNINIGNDRLYNLPNAKNNEFVYTD